MFEKFTKLVEAYFKAANVPEAESHKIIFLILLIGFLAGFISTIFVQLWQFVKYIFLLRNQRILNRDLYPFYTSSDVYNRTKYYIAPKYQNVAPSEDDEPGRKYIASAKDKLIPLFLKNVFPLGKDDNKHFLILADSGMGKTAFMINLYISYKNQWQNPFSVKKFDIKLFPIWHQDTFDYISKITEPSNTILLLDAFDEDIEASKDYKKRLAEILEKTNKFRIIVITSRTQFFPSQKEEPHETGYFTGGDRGEYKFQKLYLSVFDDNDISKYLRKKFHILFRFKKHWKAKKLVEKIPNLVVRPMLLSFIDDLIKSDFEFRYSYQVYEEMIRYWLIRESNKNGIKQRFGTERNFQELLLNFSEKLAVDMYDNREERNGLYINMNDDFKIADLELEDLNREYALTDQEIKSKSLLNRNAAGEYKFSHKSILEYFLAKELISNPNFYVSFSFKGMDAAKIFFEEIYLQRLSNDLDFRFLSNRGTGKVESSIPISKINIEKIELIEILSANNKELRFLKQFTNLKALSLFMTKSLNLHHEMCLILDIFHNKVRIKSKRAESQIVKKNLIKLMEIVSDPKSMRFQSPTEWHGIIPVSEQYIVIDNKIIELLEEKAEVVDRLETLKFEKAHKHQKYPVEIQIAKIEVTLEHWLYKKRDFLENTAMPIQNFDEWLGDIESKDLKQLSFLAELERFTLEIQFLKLNLPKCDISVRYSSGFSLSL